MLDMVEMIEIKPLITELGQIDNDGLEHSNTLPAVHNDLNSVPGTALEDRDSVELANPLESNETDKKQFAGTVHTCSLCGKCFQKRWNFIEHMRTHSDERAFECSLCHKKWVKIKWKYTCFA